jgi:ferredoxin
MESIRAAVLSAAAFDQAARLESMQQPYERRAVQADCLSEPALRHARIGIDDEQDADTTGRQVAHALGEIAEYRLLCEAQPVAEKSGQEPAAQNLFGVQTTWYHRRTPGARMQITLLGHPEPVPVQAGDTLLASLLRAGLAFPFSCQAGNCGSCKCEVVSGDVHELEYSEHALSAAERTRGVVLACRAQVLNDTVIRRIEICS